MGSEERHVTSTRACGNAELLEAINSICHWKVRRNAMHTSTTSQICPFLLWVTMRGIPSEMAGRSGLCMGGHYREQDVSAEQHCVQFNKRLLAPILNLRHQYWGMDLQEIVCALLKLCHELPIGRLEQRTRFIRWWVGWTWICWYHVVWRGKEDVSPSSVGVKWWVKACQSLSCIVVPRSSLQERAGPRYMVSTLLGPGPSMLSNP